MTDLCHQLLRRESEKYGSRLLTIIQFTELTGTIHFRSFLAAAPQFSVST